MAMKLFRVDQHPLPLPEGHRFPLEKYALLYDAVSSPDFPERVEILTAPEASDADILRAHSPEYLHKVMTGLLDAAQLRRIGFPWSPEMALRSRMMAGATLAAAEAALNDGLAATLGGGTHHARADRGEGYCVFNDTAIALRSLLARGKIGRAVVIDLDAHQGNGTAAIFAGDDSVFTFSMHVQENFPLRKEKSGLDVGLPVFVGDDEYLGALRNALTGVLAAARADLAVYLAGSDPYRDDQFGRMRLSMEGLAERDRYVLESCRALGLSVAVSMAGGYARRIEDTAAIHARTIAIAASIGMR